VYQDGTGAGVFGHEQFEAIAVRIDVKRNSASGVARPLSGKERQYEQECTRYAADAQA
jgi:hypothetical protein